MNRTARRVVLDNEKLAAMNATRRALAQTIRSAATKVCTTCRTERPQTLEWFKRARAKGSHPEALESTCCLCLRAHERVRSRKRRGPSIRASIRSAPTKACTRCKVTHPQAEEYFQRRIQTGPNQGKFSAWCRACTREHAKARQARRRADPAELGRLKAEQARYIASPKGRARTQMHSTVQNARRRSWLARVPFMWTLDEWVACRERWQNRCAYCGVVGKLTQDHFIPISHPDCPGTVPSNMVPACKLCNLSKGNRMPAEWCKDAERLARIVALLATLAVPATTPG